ncbi:MAG: hypothetical protein EAX95_11765 [Candidatus Thorarchaeota archaeon]|nr:hypothetical protein [Candidatus Thorarchaeota archaeon]
MALSIQQLRYPFSAEAREALFKVARDIRVLIDELEAPANHEIVRQAEERVYASIVQDEIRLPDQYNPASILVYQAARLIVEKIAEPRLKEYQAEAESKAANKYLANESDTYLMHLCSSAFGWNVKSTGTEAQRLKLPLLLRSFDFRIRFEDFLEVAPSFHAWNWKLINRHLDSGWVPVRKSELARLISGKFKQLILDSNMDVPTLPRRLTEAVERIETEIRGKIRKSEPVRISGDTTTAFPPCIAQIHEDSLAGKNVSHEARFALAAFLLKIGMDIKEVMSVFKAAPDFVQTLAEYQVRHISSKSAGEGYTPPGCRKMQGNSLCPVALGEVFDPLCEYVLHPLAFYQTRAWELSKAITDHGWYAKKKRKRQPLR